MYMILLAIRHKVVRLKISNLTAGINILVQCSATHWISKLISITHSSADQKRIVQSSANLALKLCLTAILGLNS